MMRLSAAIVLVMSLVSTAYGEAPKAATHRFSPCTSWTYDPSSSGYVCRFYNMNIEVPDARDNEARIVALEARVAALEAVIRELQESSDLEHK